MKQPVIFIGHGSPMNAIENNVYTKEWERIGTKLEKPKGILCISAHWLTDGTVVITNPKPETIYDFYGFPEELYKVTYPVSGSEELVNKVQNLVGDSLNLDPKHGLDHGTWVVLKRLFPKHDVPVVQLSINITLDIKDHFELGKKLSKLREEGYVIIGSGNIVHNLELINWNDVPFQWAIDFDNKIKNLIDNSEYEKLINYEKIENNELAIPTNEHYLPLLYILGLISKDDQIEYFAESIAYGSLSMRSLLIK
ncbi:MAG: 4,5-DOPA dioxygenase extradiol [bacterium]